MLSVLTGLVKGLAAPLTTWIEGKQRIQKAKVDNTVRLLESKEAYNAKWEQSGILSSGKVLKVASFSMFSFPMIWALFNPEAVKNYFEVSLASVPDWWVQTWVMITGSIWGISMLRDQAPQMVQGIRRALGKVKEPTT